MTFPIAGQPRSWVTGRSWWRAGRAASAVRRGRQIAAIGSAELYVPAGVTPPDLGPLSTASPAGPAADADADRPSLYPPAAGPVPDGARSWTVKVVNKSSAPATLFLAEWPSDDGNLGPLCGSVTPNVVPPASPGR